MSKSPGQILKDSAGSTSPADDIVITALPALTWARVLLLAKQHGVVVALCVLMAYQIGMVAQAQTYVCGV